MRMKRIMPLLASRRSHLRRAIGAFAQDELGTTAIEYALITSLIAVFMLAAVKSVGTTISAKFGNLANNMT
jgi:pilus assembly protein Flp/PilA